jgi:hypothetical protein
VVHYRVGAVLQNLGRIEDAKARYRLASELGFKGADFVLEALSAPQASAAPGAARGGGAAQTR